MVDHRMRMNTAVGWITVLAAIATRSLFRIEKCFGERIVFDFQSRYLSIDKKKCFLLIQLMETWK